MERVDPVVAFALTPRFWTTVGENLHCVDTEWFERGVHEIREQAHRIAARDEEFKGLRDLVCRYCSRMQREGWGSLKGLNSMAPACVSSALDGLAQCAEVLVDNGWPAIALVMFDEVWLLTFWLQCVIHAVMMVEPGGDTEVEHDRAGEVGAQPESIRSGVRPDVMTDSGMEGHGTTSASGRSMWERSSCVLAVTADFWGWVVDGKRTERGWRAHRDRSMLSVPPNTMPEYITFWSALSEATPDSACMYVVPATYDSHYHVPHGDGDVPLSDVRALPAASGDVLSWSGRLLHWGGRYDADAATNKRISFAVALSRRRFEGSELHGIRELEYTADEMNVNGRESWGWHLRCPSLRERLFLMTVQCCLYEDNAPMLPTVKALSDYFEMVDACDAETTAMPATGEANEDGSFVDNTL